jgi:hypothetical protein
MMQTSLVSSNDTDVTSAAAAQFSNASGSAHHLRTATTRRQRAYVGGLQRCASTAFRVLLLLRDPRSCRDPDSASGCVRGRKRTMWAAGSANTM